MFFIENDKLNSIVFDPPFLFRPRKAINNDRICNRFSYFKSFDELIEMYSNSLKEFRRILKPRGYLFFKCQDMTDDKTYFTHIAVYDLALKNGFRVRDMFVLIAKNRIYHSELKQRHARKFHSYWYVLQKWDGKNI